MHPPAQQPLSCHGVCVNVHICKSHKQWHISSLLHPHFFCCGGGFTFVIESLPFALFLLLFIIQLCAFFSTASIHLFCFHTVTHTHTKKGGLVAALVLIARDCTLPFSLHHLFKFFISPTNWMQPILPHYLCSCFSNCSYSANALIRPQPTVIHTIGRKRKLRVNNTFVFALFYAFFDNTHKHWEGLTHTQSRWSRYLFIWKWHAMFSLPIGLQVIYLVLCQWGTLFATRFLFFFSDSKETSRSA